MKQVERTLADLLDLVVIIHVGHGRADAVLWQDRNLLMSSKAGVNKCDDYRRASKRVTDAVE